MPKVKLVVAFFCMTTTALLSACDPTQAFAGISGTDRLCAATDSGHCKQPDPGDPSGI